MRAKRNTLLFKKIIGVMVLCLSTVIQFPQTVLAQDTLYISDSLRVEMRSGPSNEYRIISFLKSGTPLNFIETHKEGNWVKVTTLKGTEGWVKKIHITNNRASKDLLDDAKNKILNLESEKAKQIEKNTQLNNESDSIRKELATLRKQFLDLESEYNALKKVSNNAVQADKSNRELRNQNELYKIKVEELGTDNERLKHDQYVDGITHGMFAVLLGGILALVLMQFGGRRRRNSSW